MVQERRTPCLHKPCGTLSLGPVEVRNQLLTCATWRPGLYRKLVPTLLHIAGNNCDGDADLGPFHILDALAGRESGTLSIRSQWAMALKEGIVGNSCKEFNHQTEQAECLQTMSWSECITPSHSQSLANFVANVHSQGISAVRTKICTFIHKNHSLSLANSFATPNSQLLV